MHQMRSAAGRDVRQGDLKALANVSGSNFRLVDPDLSDQDVVLRGDYRQVRLRSGLLLHATDTREMHDLKTQAVQRAGLTFSLFLSGDVKAWFGDRAFSMGSAGSNSRKLEAVAIARATPDTFARQSVRGMHVRKVNITVTPEWLEDGGLDAVADHAAVLRFSRDHLACARWKPTPRLVTLAEQILRPAAYAPLLQNLYCESRAIEFIAEALHAIARADPAGDDAGIRPQDVRRTGAICDFLEEHLDEAFTLQSIARDVGMSVNTMQRLFRATHGTTVFEHVRARKLQRAREALERDGVSVAQAAYIAGYAGAANFATAFKRAFGLSPKNFRGSAYSVFK